MCSAAFGEVFECEDAFGTTHLTNLPPDERYEQVKGEDSVYKVEQSWDKHNDITTQLMQILKEIRGTKTTVSVSQKIEEKAEEDELDIPDELGLDTEIGKEEMKREKGLDEEEEEDMSLAAKKPWFGIQVTLIDRKLQEEYKLDSKNVLLVKDVAVNSPAEKSKVRIGDVVTSITDMYNDETDINETGDLDKVLSEVTREDRIRFTINRKGNLYILLLAVGERPKKLAEGEWY